LLRAGPGQPEATSGRTNHPMTEHIESEAMREVREWKRLRNEEVADLPTGEAIRRMMDLADGRSVPLIARMKELQRAGARLSLPTAKDQRCG